MVKRTAWVLGVLSILIVVAGTCFAGGYSPVVGGTMFPSCLPKFVPIEAPEYCPATIIKKYEACITGPCPPVMPRYCGSSCGSTRLGLFGGLAAAIPMPVEWLFGGFGGVYGPTLDTMVDAPFGPAYGPVPGAVAAIPMMMASPTTLFGELW